MGAIAERFHALDLVRFNVVEKEHVVWMNADRILISLGSSPKNLVREKCYCSLFACLHNRVDEVLLPAVENIPGLRSDEVRKMFVILARSKHPS